MFLNPAYLFGLLAALIPLIIHLSRSRRTKKMQFSTTRFFTDQFLRSYRMSQLKELLLLGCRMALFALLATALAQPLIRPSGGPTLSAGPRTVLLVLDDSASMGYSEGGQTLFDRARTAAINLVDSLGSGDQVSVILAGRRATGAEVLFPDATEDHDDARRVLRQTQVTRLGTDLTGAIAAAEQLAVAARVAGRSVGVYVLSDLQESGFDLPETGTVRTDVSDVAYFFVSVRPQKVPANRAVTAVRYAATRPRVGVPFALRPLVALGSDDGKDVGVRVVIDGARVGEQKLERLPGGKWATPRFYHTFAGPGWHGGHVEVDDNALSFDDRRYFTVEVPATTQTVNVLAVNGAPSSVASQDELFFLRIALTAAPDGQQAPFKLTAVAPGEVTSQPLDTFPLVILANVERLSDDAVDRLEKYVDEGGKLLVFLGDKVNPAWYNDRLAAASRRNGGLLPARIDDGGKVDDVGFIGAINYEHRALAAFQEPRLGTLLGPALTFKAMRTTAPPQQVLMKSSSGAPLLAEKGFGKGKVLLFTSTCDRDWSDFPVRPGFLLWSRFVAEYLTQAPLNLQGGHATGDIVRLTPPPGETGSLWVQKPGGAKVIAPMASDGSGNFDFADTLEPGVYAVLRSDQEMRVGLFAVNLDTYESDLTYLDEPLPDEASAAHVKRVEAELKGRLGGAPLVSYLKDAGQAPATLGGSSGRYELWYGLLILVLLVGLFEPWLANQISSRLYAGKPPVVNVPTPDARARVEQPEEVAR